MDIGVTSALGDPSGKSDYDGPSSCGLGLDDTKPRTERQFASSGGNLLDVRPLVAVLLSTLVFPSIETLEADAGTAASTIVADQQPRADALHLHMAT